MIPADIKPASDGSCSEQCPMHDGKRCSLLGHRTSVCSPMFNALKSEREALIDALPNFKLNGSDPVKQVKGTLADLDSASGLMRMYLRNAKRAEKAALLLLGTPEDDWEERHSPNTGEDWTACRWCSGEKPNHAEKCDGETARALLAEKEEP